MLKIFDRLTILLLDTSSCEGGLRLVLPAHGIGYCLVAILRTLVALLEANNLIHCGFLSMCSVAYVP